MHADQPQAAQGLASVGQPTRRPGHDLNNLWGIVGGHAELLLRMEGLPTAARQRVEAILQAVDRGSALSRRLLAEGKPPRAEAAPVPESPRPQPGRRGHGRVLLVEDEQVLRQALAEVLRSHGYEVAEAADAQGACKLARAVPGGVDVLVTDLLLPDRPGRRLADELVGQHPGLRVVYMSGSAADAGDEAFELRVGERFLPKPFRLTALVDAVRKALDTSEEG